MKEAGESHWTSPNTGATNESGFTALPGGYRATNGAFDPVGFTGFWWSSTGNDTDDAWGRGLNYHYSRVLRSSYNKDYGFSVRCLRD